LARHVRTIVAPIPADHSANFAAAATKAKYAEHADAIAATAAMITDASMQRPFQRACSAARRAISAFAIRCSKQSSRVLICSNVLASAKTVAAVERLARSDRRVIAGTDQWDGDPFLLATPNGTVDLDWQDQESRSARLHHQDHGSIS
jgi:phage/plasmid-associated DNA primase